MDPESLLIYLHGKAVAFMPTKVYTSWTWRAS
jgi:hypothetical protein